MLLSSQCGNYSLPTDNINNALKDKYTENSMCGDVCLDPIIDHLRPDLNTMEFSITKQMLVT